MQKIRIIVAALAASAAAVTGIVLSTSPAGASTSPVTAFTVSPEHADTTGITCSACLQGSGGPIWANDHLVEHVTVTSAGTANHYNVKIRFGGSTFSGFADPRASGEAGSNGDGSGGPMFSQGAITGNITYDDITSANPPSGSGVQNPEPPGTGLGAVLSQVFSNGNGPAVSTHYTVNYTPSLDSVDPTGTTTDNVWAKGVVYNQTG